MMNENAMNLVTLTFQQAEGHAVDFPEAEYKAALEQFSEVAQRFGYRLAGYRLHRAVLTSKPLAPDARNFQEITLDR